METTEKILRGAEELFMRYGIKSITMDEIAKHLGISKKTIYQFFEDKDEIVFMSCKKHLCSDAECLQVISRGAANAVEEIFNLSEFLRNTVVRTHPSVLFDLQKYHKSSWDLYLSHKETVIEKYISSNIRRGIEEGLYRAEINVSIISHIRLDMIQMAFNPDIFPPTRYNLMEVHMQLMEHFIYGLLSPKGYETLQELKNKARNLAN
ncbi:TetR/AcrR family transcriptional regulator [Flexibacter flexilis]|nr:TetR/AcrR family transcriptional regulator [Flexibacter flexilis]